MPKHEEFTEQQELNLFFNSTVPPAGTPEAKKLVEEAPFHPGYEGAVIRGLDTAQIPVLNQEDIIKLNGWGAQPTININTDPSPQNIPFDWRKITFTSGMVTGSGSAGGSAMKFDSGKLPVNLLSSEALLQTAAVLKFGADKYHAHNWRDGFAWSRPLAAAMRHIMAFNDGEDKDPESGLSHLAHAACCIMFLLEFEKTHPHLDDRYKVDVHKTKKPSK
jgi:Domain of unknown function (DUF5664)